MFCYGKSESYTFNVDDVRLPYSDGSVKRAGYRKTSLGGGVPESEICELNNIGRFPEDWWDIPILRPNAKERLGYPTQKPLALLERIIKASSDPGDIVLDPFCGCGTTVHAAENLGRQWIGIDISSFSVELINERVLANFNNLSNKDVAIFGLPETISDAEQLAEKDRFEFEKWACGKIGANGMGKRLGDRGADGGIDGVIELIAIRNGKVEKETAIVQVKSGGVSADSVRALSEVVRRSGSMSGILVCFDKQMGTVENQRDKGVWSDDYGTYPNIQGFSVEQLLAGDRPVLPSLYGVRRGGRMTVR